MWFFYRLLFVGFKIISVLHLAHSMILLTANVEDLRRVAEKFLPEPMILNLQKVLMKLAQDKKKDISRENDDNAGFQQMPEYQYTDERSKNFKTPKPKFFTSTTEPTTKNVESSNEKVNSSEVLSIDWKSLLNDIILQTATEASTTQKDRPTTAEPSRVKDKRTNENNNESSESKQDDSSQEESKAAQRAARDDYVIRPRDDDVIRPPKRGVTTTKRERVQDEIEDDFKGVVTPPRKRVMQRAGNSDILRKQLNQTTQAKTASIEPRNLVGTSGLVMLTRKPSVQAWWESKLTTEKALTVETTPC